MYYFSQKTLDKRRKVCYIAFNNRITNYNTMMRTTACVYGTFRELAFGASQQDGRSLITPE